MELAFEKMGGLIPAVIQDEESREVLMLGFVNEEAVQRSLAERRSAFLQPVAQAIMEEG